MQLIKLIVWVLNRQLSRRLICLEPHGHLALVYNALLGLTSYPSEWFDVVLLDEAGWFM